MAWVQLVEQMRRAHRNEVMGLLVGLGGIHLIKLSKTTFHYA